MKNKIFFSTLFVLTCGLLSVSSVYAQSTPTSWSQCNDGRTISRCETYDCPRGDTNNDGKCTLTDTDARLTDARNDSFCANPIAGCGQVHYYPSGATDACLVRVQETETNCELYAVKTPNFTPRPTASPTTAPAGGQTTCISLTSTPLSGSAPLTVDLDVNSTGAAKGYEFEIKKPGVTAPGVVSQVSRRLRQVFATPGKYEIKASVLNSDDEKITSLSCNATVTVTETELGRGGGGDSELPKTGPEHMWIGAFVLLLGAAGVYIYEKHKTV